MFLINFNQWKCACVGINNWVILLRARYKFNHSWGKFMKATKVGSQNQNESPQSAEPRRDNIKMHLKETGSNNAKVIVGFELLTSCRLLMNVIMEICVPFGMHIFFQNLNANYSTRTQSAPVTQLFSSSNCFGLVYIKGEWKGIFLFNVPWLRYVPPGLTFSNSTFCPHSVFMCFVWIWEQTAIISLYSINWLVFITETECVYCAVRA